MLLRRKLIFVIIIFLLQSYYVHSQYLNKLKSLPFSEEVLSSKLYSTNGNTITLKTVIDSLKGNVVLIDFWASWCSPCIREMPYSKKLVETYKNNKIAFLFLSTDTDNKKWLRGLAKINIKGYHYRIDAGSKKAIQEYLKIRGIPYYVLLDTDGTIYDPKANWPHTEKLKNSIDFILKTNM